MNKMKNNFMKLVLVVAFVQITLYTVWQMVVFTMTGNEASTLTQWLFTLWGIEIGLLMLKRLLDDKRDKGGVSDGHAEFSDQVGQESDWAG